MELDPSLRTPMPDSIPFMFPRLLESPRTERSLVEEIFYGDEWDFEPKLDGFRLQAIIKGGKVTLLNSELHPFRREYPSITRQLAQIGHDAALDGELVVVTREGKMDPRLLNRNLEEGETRLVIFWDQTYRAGYDLRRMPYAERKAILAEELGIFPLDSTIQLCVHSERPFRLLRTVMEWGLEGLVAKRVNSPYVAGLSNYWRKIRLYTRRRFGPPEPTEWSRLLTTDLD